MKRILIVLILVVLLLIYLNFDIHLYVSLKDVSRIESLFTGAGLAIVAILSFYIIRSIIIDIKEGNKKIRALMSEVDRLLYLNSPTAEERRRARLEKYGYLADPDIVALRTGS